MAQFYATLKPSSQAHHRWRIGSLPRGTLYGVPFFWRGGSYVSDVVTEKHLIDALLSDPDVKVDMVTITTSPVVDATLVDITPEPVTPVEVSAVSEAWLEVDDELEPDLGDEEEEKPVVRRKPGRQKKGDLS